MQKIQSRDEVCLVSMWLRKGLKENKTIINCLWRLHWIIETFSLSLFVSLSFSVSLCFSLSEHEMNLNLSQQAPLLSPALLSSRQDCQFSPVACRPHETWKGTGRPLDPNSRAVVCQWVHGGGSVCKVSQAYLRGVDLCRRETPRAASEYF